jgi:hypothetical protein
MQVGIAGSAATEGVRPTGGAPGTAGIMTNAAPGAKRALIFWGAAVALLFIFHVGGAKLG